MIGQTLSRNGWAVLRPLAVLEQRNRNGNRPCSAARQGSWVLQQTASLPCQAVRGVQPRQYDQIGMLWTADHSAETCWRQ